MNWIAVFVTSASAQDAGPPYSIDIELLRPAFGRDGFSGVDAPIPGGRLTTRYGAVLQYEEAPLTLVQAQDHTQLGAVVSNRLGVAMGMSLDIERTTFSLLLPAAANWGSDVALFENDGFGVGDAGASARLVVLDTRFLNAGVRTGVILPTGKQGAYMGEAGPRLGGGLLASLEAGPLMVASDVGITTRTAVRTNEDFVAANELSWGSAARFALPDATRVAGTVQLLTRAGLADFLTGGAENSAEALGGVEIYPNHRVTLGIEAGRGLTQGYGTTDFRMLTSLVIDGEKRAEPVAWVPPPPPPPPPGSGTGTTTPTVKDKVLEDILAGAPAKQVDGEILSDIVEFVVDTDILQPYSIPILEAVAAIINDNPRIGHLVIEGHASREGSYEHNYELAESRAQAIWEFMLEHGVAEARVSYKGMGEVKPLSQDGKPLIDEDEATLQKNRRVRFAIVQELPVEGPFPEYPATQLLPWTGDEVEVVQPPEPEPTQAPAPKRRGIPSGDE